jgi:hypothetical protein
MLKKQNSIRSKLHSPQDYHKEAVRYYKNAKDRLKEARIEHNRYQDAKPVQEACGIGYLSVLLALDGYFVSRGVESDKLPTSTEGYWDYFKKYLVHDGKIIDAFSTAYENLHLLGYYRGGLGVEMIKEGFKNAKLVIDTLYKE